MNSKWRRFAPFGLYLSLAAALLAIGLVVVQREWNLYLQICLGLIIVGLAIFAILDPERVRQALTGRQARHGSNALILSLAFLGILIVINYLVYQNPVRKDLTEDKQFTLAAETIDTLGSLKVPVVAKAFFTPRNDSTKATDLLYQYKFYSDGNFDYEFIDPEMNPVAAEKANISRDGMIVVTMGDQQEPVSVVTERELTGALVRLINPEQRKVYFLTGHGEYSPDDTGDQSYSQVRQTLESKNYTVETLNLLTSNQVPEDAKVIVIAGPQKPVSTPEIDILDGYLSEGGSLIVMQEPSAVTDFGDNPDPMLDYLQEIWGVSMGEDIVIDTTSNQPFAPFAAEYGSHVITEKLLRTTSQFPSARSVSAENAVDGVSQAQLVFTAPQSWAETDLQGLVEGTEEASLDEGQDLPGPISLAVAAENFGESSRVVILGDSDFASDANFYIWANGDLIINSIDWAAGQEDLINLTPKETTQRMMLPPNPFTLNLILLGMVIILPGLTLVAGILVWIQRRRRG
jgi:ABC-type uncharacterized transport system involved in gliding motility auxiliary subunit